MANHHFISYSTKDAKDFAITLCDTLKSGPPSISAWLDKRELKPGPHWDDQIVEAIRTCDSLIFVMTRDSVESASVCKNEWTRAIRYKKPIIPILLHEDAEIPFQLENRQYIDFSDDFETALAKLRNHLEWLRSPEGKLQVLKDRLTDANRDLQRTDDPKQQKRIQEDIDSLKKQISNQEQIVADPNGAAQRAQENINRGLERERKPEKPVTGISKTKFINPPPGIVPTYFQDRYVETTLIRDFLTNDAQRLLTIAGRAGVGKTAMVCRLLKSLESSRLPDDLGELKVDGIVYLSESGSRKVNFVNLFFDLCKLLPEDVDKKLDGVYKDAKAPTFEKTYALLRAFPQGRIVLLLDNFEDKIEPQTGDIRDAELDEALKAFLTSEQHAVKVILTTRVAPHNLLLVEPGRQQRLDLDEGLEHPYAENILKEMDKDGKVGLKDATDELLNEARLRTKGFPRALEALFGILSADRDTSLQEILADAEKLLPEHIVEKLVGEAFSRLDATAQMVIQALAIYGRPVTNSAVDFLLQPYLQSVDSAPVLSRLVNMHFIRKERSLYYLHPVDREYALSRVPIGEPSDKHLENEVFSQYALLHRGADFFREARRPRQDWKTIDDLAPQLAEFELRYSGQDFDTASEILLEIDFDYLLLWGHYQLVAMFHECLQGKLTDPELMQSSVGNLGTAYNNMGQVKRAVACYEEALAIAREMYDIDGQAAWLGNLGGCYQIFGQNQQAMDNHEQALAIYREIGDRDGEAANLGSLGGCYHTLGQTKQAMDNYEQALAIYREIGNRGGEAANLGSLGGCYETLGKTKQAMDNYEQALGIYREIGDRGGEAANLGRLGGCYQTLGQTKQAMDNYEQALAIYREIGDRGGEAANLGSLGSCYETLGKTRQAMDNYEQALEIAREIGDRMSEGAWLGSLGNCYSYLGKTQRAIEYYDQALEIAREIVDRKNECIWLGNLGLCYSDLGETQRAIEYYEQSLEIARVIGDRQGESYTLCNLGLCYYNLGEIQRAIECWGQSLDIAREIGLSLMEAFNLTYMGEVFIDQDRFDKALESLKQAKHIADDIEYNQLRNEARYYLSLAFLYANDLTNANGIIEQARKYDCPPNNHNVWALQGLIHLCERNLEATCEAFTTAAKEADILLGGSAHNYDAMDSKGLSLCGLAICKKDKNYVEEAKQAYKKAREINKDKGYVRRVLRLFDKLANADTEGLLKDVRTVIQQDL